TCRAISAGWLSRVTEPSAAESVAITRHLNNRARYRARVAGNYAAVFHLVDPIASFSDDGIVRGQEQRFTARAHDTLQQLKGALGIGGVEVPCRFVCQDDPRVVGQSAGDSHTLLFASGKVPARSAQFVTQANRVEQASSAFTHLTIRKLPQLARRDHHVLLRSEILHQKMKLKNEADELAPSQRQFVIA